MISNKCLRYYLRCIRTWCTTQTCCILLYLHRYLRMRYHILLSLYKERMRLLLICKFISLLCKKNLSEYESSVLLSGFHYFARVGFVFLLAVAAYVPSVLNMFVIEPSNQYKTGVLENGVVTYVDGVTLEVDMNAVLGDVFKDVKYRVIVYLMDDLPIEVWTIDALKYEYARGVYIVLAVTLFICTMLRMLCSRLNGIMSCILWIKYCSNENS